jgi:DNA-binding transcriptional LysR family regulator
LDQMRKRMPNARLKFLNLPTAEAVKRLAEGAIDFALVRKDALSRPLQAKSLGVMGYSLFVPSGLLGASGQQNPVKVLGGLPLATLEGEGSFRGALARVAARARTKLNIQIECSSFPLAARAVAKGGVAAILPSIAETDFEEGAVVRLKMPLLRAFDREMCLAMNPRLLRIRPALQAVADAISQTCRL